MESKRPVWAITWTKSFTEREIKGIDFNQIYADNFNHGTDGHNAKIIIAKLSNMLNAINSAASEVNPDIDKIKRVLRQDELQS